MPRFTSAVMTLIISLALFWPTPAAPQALTVAALLASADRLVNELRNLITSGSVETQRTIGSAITEINGLEGQLRADVQDLNMSIENLGITAQNSANTLLYIIDHTNDLVTKQRSCLDLDINLFEAGLQTTLASAKSGIPCM